VPQHVRIYLPLTREQCRELAESRRLPGGRPAYAVTEAVRGSDPGGDLESWEYAALQDAAAAALTAGQPVIVAAVDVDRDQVDDRPSTGSRVEVVGEITLPRVAALHVGDDVLGASLQVEPGAEIELSWYDTTELEHLVSLW
jgi:hypothetical protein